MHSSRMRTGRSLTVCYSLLPGRGVSTPGEGVCLLRGGLLLGGSAPGGGVSAARGVCSQGCLLPGGCLFQGVGCYGPMGSAPEGGLLLRGSALGGVCSWGVFAARGCLLWGVSAPGGYSPRGVCSWEGSAPRGVCSWGLLRGGCIPACTEADTPPCGQTHACENITLAQLRCGR